MERVMKKLPLYLLLGVPAGYACIQVLGHGWGLLAGVVANLALWHILLPKKEEGDDSN
jgi:hypothetical protein